MAPRRSSSEWSKKKVVERLRKQASKGSPVSAQVFLHDTVGEDLSSVVKELVAKADLRVAAEVLRRKQAQEAEEKAEAERAAMTKEPIVEEEEVPDAA